MKNSVFSLLILLLLIITIPSKSQNNNVRESVKYINALLKENPYLDSFQEITFYYSIDIITDNELIIKMELDGPFKTLYRSKISDLDPVAQNNPAMIASTYICWNCKSTETKENNSCVINETVYEGGNKEVHTSGNICVMFSNENNVYDKLFDEFDHLFNECKGNK